MHAGKGCSAAVRPGSHGDLNTASTVREANRRAGRMRQELPDAVSQRLAASAAAAEKRKEEQRERFVERRREKRKDLTDFVFYIVAATRKH